MRRSTSSSPSFPPFIQSFSLTPASLTGSFGFAWEGRFAEILSDEVLVKMKAAPKSQYPVLKAADMPAYDGFLFGSSSPFVESWS